MDTALPADLQEVIHVSTLADDAPVIVVANIANEARSHNRQAEIAGLLVFDGMHFCQQFEGRAVPSAVVMERISRDPHHHHLAVVHRGPLDKRRFSRFSRFSLGYTSVEEVELLVRLQQLQGQAALEAFLNLLCGLDMDG